MPQNQSQYQWITIKDFTPGLYNNTSVTNAPIGSCSVSSGCFALPTGELIPLPAINNVTVPAIGTSLNQYLPLSNLHTYTTGFFVHNPVVYLGNDLETSIEILVQVQFATQDATLAAGVQGIVPNIGVQTTSLFNTQSNYYFEEPNSQNKILETNIAPGSSFHISGTPFSSTRTATATSLIPDQVGVVFLSYDPNNYLPNLYIYPNPDINNQNTSFVPKLIMLSVDYLSGTAEYRIFSLVNSVNTWPGIGGQFVSNEFMSFTDPPGSTTLFAGTSTISAYNVYVPENPSGYGTYGSIGTGSLFLVKNTQGGVLVSGDILAPSSVTYYPGVVGTNGLKGVGAASSIGFIYLSHKIGAYVWTGGSTASKLSNQVTPNTVLPQIPEGAFSNAGISYKLIQWGDFIVFPNGMLYNVITNSWFYSGVNSNWYDTTVDGVLYMMENYSNFVASIYQGNLLLDVDSIFRNINLQQDTIGNWVSTLPGSTLSLIVGGGMTVLGGAAFNAMQINFSYYGNAVLQKYSTIPQYKVQYNTEYLFYVYAKSPQAGSVVSFSLTFSYFDGTPAGTPSPISPVTLNSTGWTLCPIYFTSPPPPVVISSLNNTESIYLIVTIDVSNTVSSTTPQQVLLSNAGLVPTAPYVNLVPNTNLGIDMWDFSKTTKFGYGYGLVSNEIKLLSSQYPIDDSYVLSSFFPVVANTEYNFSALIDNTEVVSGGIVVDIVAVEMLTNLLTAVDSSFEGGVGTWFVNVNCAVAQSSAKALQGTYSLAVTATAAGAFSAQTGLYPVVAGQTYNAILSSLAAATSENVKAGLAWFNSSNKYISITQDAALADSTSEWTQASVKGVAPTGATSVRVVATWANAAAGEIHYIDEVALYQSAPSANLIPDTSDLHTWSLVNAGGIFSIAPSPLGGNQFQALGNGSVTGFVFPTSQIFVVTPGQTYILSGYVDASQVTLGTLLFAIYDSAVSTGYIQLYQKAGVKGTVASAPWTCPVGLTEVVVVADTNNATINSGQYAIFSQFQLTLGSTPQTYVQGSNWVVGGSFYQTLNSLIQITTPPGTATIANTNWYSGSNTSIALLISANNTVFPVGTTYIATASEFQLTQGTALLPYTDGVDYANSISISPNYTPFPNTYALDPSVPSTTFTWTSNPITPELNRKVIIQEIALVSSGSGTIEIIIQDNLDSTVNSSYTFTVSSTYAMEQRAKFALTSSSFSVTINSLASNPSISQGAAPTINSLSIAYNEAQLEIG